MSTNICICGGGSLGHVCAGVLASQENIKVNILTQHPSLWSKEIVINDINKKQYIGKINLVTDNPKEALMDCTIVFLCLPGFAIEETMHRIKPYLTEQSIIGSIVCSTGFFFAAHKILDKRTKLFGFQRTPYIARTVSYGHSANLLGYKPEVAIATENISNTEQFRILIENLWLTPTKLLNNYYEVSLTNSNPILHTGRLYTMWSEPKNYLSDHQILFYKEWTIEASQTIIDMDNEFMQLLQVLPIKDRAIPSLLDYYESTDANSLTQKISSIKAFQTILAPMIKTPNGWVPDFQSRYFTEDFPYGLRFIYQLTKEKNIQAPTIEKIYQWGINKVNCGKVFE